MSERSRVPAAAARSGYSFCFQPLDNLTKRYAVGILLARLLQHFGLVFIEYQIVAFAFVVVHPFPAVQRLVAADDFALLGLKEVLSSCGSVETRQ